jgi:hypothetical protein
MLHFHQTSCTHLQQEVCCIWEKQSTKCAQIEQGPQIHDKSIGCEQSDVVGKAAR